MGHVKHLIDQKLKGHDMCQSCYLCQISSLTTTTGWTCKISDEEYDKTISACQYLNMAK